jgi:uncharacterized protein (TIGR02246 family)
MIARAVMAVALLALPGTVAAQGATGRTVEQRLQRAEDEIAIERLLIDYAATLDARDYAAYAALFTPDGEWVNGDAARKGRPAIEAMLAAIMGPAGTPNHDNFHLLANPRISVEGDRATAASLYLFVMRGKGGQPLAVLAGSYADELVRTEGQWKIRRRIAANIMPTAQEWTRFIAAQAGR